MRACARLRLLAIAYSGLSHLLLPSVAGAVEPYNSADYRVNKNCGGNRKLNSAHVVVDDEVLVTRSDIECGLKCELEPVCKSFDYDQSARQCRLGRVPFYTDCSNSVGADNTSSHYDHVSDRQALNAALGPESCGVV